jgi:carbamoyltransferase
MPSPGDSGSAIGAVLANKKLHIPFDTTFLGYDMGQKDSDYDIVDYLLKNKICGIARGKAEFGPRGLGNRSLIADPRGSEIKTKVNSIKHRQQFRPFSPMILEEHAHNYFKMPPKWETSPFMQVTAICKSPMSYPAIIHVDGTSRVQTVAKGSGGLRRVLELWYEKTNCPMLLNTSLNIKGQPMVNTITDARDFEIQNGIKVFT